MLGGINGGGNLRLFDGVAILEGLGGSLRLRKHPLIRLDGREVADQLGQPLPSGFDLRAANRQTYAGDRSAWLTAEARDRIATIYAADFDLLGYDPRGEA